MHRWKEQQLVNEQQLGGGYVYIYRGLKGEVIQQSKSLILQDVEQVYSVCTRDDGRIVLRTSIISILKDENMNAHSFRHTHATRLIENGASAKGVATRLGHTNTQITQNLYTHNTLAIFDKNLQTNS